MAHSLFAVAVVVGALGVGACSRTTSAPRDEERAGDEHPVAPETVGLDPTVIAGVVRQGETDPRRDLQSLVVARRGTVAVEHYFHGARRDDLHDIRSATKSLTGTLVGIALEDGKLQSLDQRVRPLLGAPASGDARWNELTVRHLLEMRSGLDANDWIDDSPSPGTEARMEAASDRLRFALDTPMRSKPGDTWQYASVNTLLLGRIVAAATGRPLETYAEQKLFSALGITRYEWLRDAQGHVVPQGNLRLRSRDLVKLGILFAAGGRWNGQQLVARAWIDSATRERTTFEPDPATGLGELYRGYGDHWWTGRATVGTRTVAFYFASGNGGQRLFVVPSEELVVVVTSTAYNRGYAHRRAHSLLEGILSALR